MATTNDCQLALGTLISTWFASPDPKYTVPIDAENIKSFNTTPADSSSSPNWIIIRTLSTVADAEVFGGTDLPPRLAITLLSRISDSDSSREAAERWLNDAEELLVEQLHDIGPTANWYGIEIVGIPRRDIHGFFHGKYRTSDVIVDIDKIV